MAGHRQEDSDDLLGSVQDWFNLLCGVELRVKEQGQGLTEPEKRLLRSLSGQSRVLDIGCAAGRASLALAAQGHAVTGIDVAERLSAKAQGAAERESLPVTFQVCDPLSLPFDDHTFDAALLLKTYCYVPTRQSRLAWLAEIARVVAPAGWLFLSQYVIDDVLGN